MKTIKAPGAKKLCEDFVNSKIKMVQLINKKKGKGRNSGVL